jgi:hypothetical protein
MRGTEDCCRPRTHPNSTIAVQWLRRIWQKADLRCDANSVPTQIVSSRHAAIIKDSANSEAIVSPCGKYGFWGWIGT